MTDELKPCPFCGGKDFWRCDDDIECNYCGAFFCAGEKEWNTRPIEDAKDEEIAMLREKLAACVEALEAAVDRMDQPNMQTYCNDVIEVLLNVIAKAKGEA